jgi:nucleotide-binding universal stress UspA family protein
MSHVLRMNIYGGVLYGEQMYQRIVVALNGLPESRRAFDSAVELAVIMKATLTTLSVIGSLPAYSSYATVIDPLTPQEIEETRYRMQRDSHEEAKALARERGINTESMIIAGHDVKTVVEFLHDHQADLLVLGLHQHDFYISRLWNSIYDLALGAPCSVLGVH